MDIMATITIKVNRIYFEQFEAPCGLGDETTEIRLAWERAAIEVIAAGKFHPNLETTHVGQDPAPVIFVEGEGVTCDYAESEGEDDCAGVAAYDAIITEYIEPYGRLIAEKAIEAGHNAARTTSDIFVAESEACNDN